MLLEAEKVHTAAVTHLGCAAAKATNFEVSYGRTRSRPWRKTHKRGDAGQRRALLVAGGSPSPVHPSAAVARSRAAKII